MSTPSIINDPTVRDQIKARYESGEREALAQALGVAMTTLRAWASQFRWTSTRPDRATRRAQVVRLRAAGLTNVAIAEELGVTEKTVRNILAELATLVPADRTVVTYAAPVTAEPEPSRRPPGQVGGWHCSSCTWWGESAEAFKEHKKTHGAYL